MQTTQQRNQGLGIALLILFSIGASDFAMAATSTPMVQVQSPRGGSVYNPGTSVSIQWVAQGYGSIATVSLSYAPSATSGTWTPIGTNISNSGAHSWTVPNLYTSSARIRLTATDSIGKSFRTESEAFTINGTKPTVRTATKTAPISTSTSTLRSR